MILSDNETKLDLLNNQAIARTIVSIIKDSKESISIGVHGDWGAGKSSILAMVEEEVSNVVEKNNNNEKPFKATSIRFNGWQHQGFEDSKIALMSAIVSQLVELAEEHLYMLTMNSKCDITGVFLVGKGRICRHIPVGGMDIDQVRPERLQLFVAEAGVLVVFSVFRFIEAPTEAAAVHGEHADSRQQQ